MNSDRTKRRILKIFFYWIQANFLQYVIEFLKINVLNKFWKLRELIALEPKKFMCPYTIRQLNYDMNVNIKNILSSIEIKKTSYKIKVNFFSSKVPILKQK